MGYLYGAAIQGIQDFIFETNKLKEIIGASEIVEQLSEEKFKNRFCVDKDAFIMHAAGNIKLITEHEDKIKEIVKYWPEEVEKIAPGLTLSQAVVEFDGKLTKNNIDNLEEKLKTARNRVTVSQQISPMAAVRSRRTGKPAVDWQDKSISNEQGAPRDLASRLKQDKGHNEAPQNLMEKSLEKQEMKKRKYYPFDISDMLFKGEETGWLAVIHADGNSLGKIIQKMAEQLQNTNAGNSKGNDNLRNGFKQFSSALDKSTINAARHAVEKVVLPDFEDHKREKFAFRPVVIGGDDLTIIIRADLALDFTENFLKQFQKETKENLKTLVNKFSLKDFENGLTACAGIAYLKASYPFHYAVKLAESLCTDAKKASKKIHTTDIPASLTFHKIQDSFTQNYDEIIARELSPCDNISFKYGPYSIDNSQLPALAELKKQVKFILEKEAPKSGIRKWLSLVYQDKNQAGLWLERVQEIAPHYVKKLNLNKAVENNKTHLYNVLSIASITKIKEGNSI